MKHMLLCNLYYNISIFQIFSDIITYLVYLDILSGSFIKGMRNNNIFDRNDGRLT